MLLETSAFSRRAAVDKLRAALPSQIDNHQILQIIGSGAYGDVALARNLLTGTYRAIKIVWRPAFKDERPYQRELDAIRFFEPISRSHEGFVQILQVGELEDGFYYFMELADDARAGRVIDPKTYIPHSLARKSAQTSSPDECISIGLQLARALEVLHEKQLIHRDIKPSNIIFVDGRPKLADIGLVTQIAEANSFVGTAGFVPPEGPVSPVSDIFSLGKVIYEIATGKDRCEFPELPEQFTLEHRDLYLELNQIVLKACDPDPSRRYHSAKAMARELEMLGAGASIKRLRQLQQRFRIAAVLTSVLMVCALVALAVKEVRARERANILRRIAYVTTRGTDYLKEGDYASAQPFFAMAAMEDKENELSHRLRIGATMARAVKPIKVWQSARGATFSPNGLRHVVGVSNRVEIRDARSGELQTTFPIDRPGIIKINQDDLIGVASGRELLLRDWSTGEKRRVHIPEVIYNYNFNPVRPEAVICSTNFTRVLHLDSGEIEEIPSDADDPTIMAVYAASGDKLIMGRASGKTEVWSRGPWRSISATFKHNMVYTGRIDHENEDRILSCGFDFAVYWDARTGQQISARLAHKFGIFCVAVSPDGSVLASGGLDRVVRLSSPTSLVPQPENSVLYHPDRVLGLAFLDDATLVVHCGDGSNTVWNLKPDTEIETVGWREVEDPYRAKNGGLSIQARDKAVVVTKDDSKIAEFELNSEVSSVAIHPNARQFALGSRDQHGSRYAALLYDLKDPSEPAMRLPHMDGINAVKYSPSGRIIVTCSEDHTAILWDSSTGRALASPLRHDWQVTWAAFNRDETWVATASWDSTVRIWDTRTGEPLAPPFQFPEFLEWVQFDNHGEALLAANVAAKRLYRLQLPLAERPFERYRNALPAPDSLVVSPAGF